MKLTRFCSRAEYEKFINGEKLVNTTDHGARGARSKSVGFCFAADKPNAAFEYLGGIVCPEVCMVLDFPNPEKDLQKATAYYANHNGEWGDVIPITDYCTTSYSKDIATLISADFSFNTDVVRLATEIIKSLRNVGL